MTAATGPRAATRAGEDERRRMVEQFCALCAIPSPSGREDAVAAAVRAELEGLGLAVEADAAGNLVARVPARTPGAPVVALCAHLDTVPHGDVPIEPVLVDDAYVNRHDAILGADNKAAVAMLLAIARRAAAGGGAAVGLELVLTVGEELLLAGVKELDRGGLQAGLCFVFDHATPIGEIIVASPTAYRVTAEFHGRAAHAGIRPEDGRSAIVAAARAVAAMELGRLDAETTANVGTIRGGAGGTNIVPERCTVWGEARSLDAGRADAVVAGMVDRLQEAANHPACACDVDVDVERAVPGYRHAPDAPGVAAAEAALRACGYTPRHVASGGGSDANVLQDRGLHTINLANGTERAHEPGERVTVAALHGMLDVTLTLLDGLAG